MVLAALALHGLYPHLQTLNSQPSTFDPQPTILKPHPSTLNPQPSTLDPQPSTLNSKPSTLNPQHGIANPPQTPEPLHLTPKPRTVNLELERLKPELCMPNNKHQSPAPMKIRLCRGSLATSCRFQTRRHKPQSSYTPPSTGKASTLTPECVTSTPSNTNPQSRFLTRAQKYAWVCV